MGGSSTAGSSKVHQTIRENCFDHPLDIRVSPQSQTFSHPHRLTVFPPFPAPGQQPQNSSSSSSAGTRANNNNNSHHKSNNPFAFVRGLRIKKRGGDLESLSTPLSSSSSCGAASSSAVGCGWTSCSVPGQDFSTSYPLASKSRSDHSLHRILKDENAWTVFATLRPPSCKMMDLNSIESN